MLKHKTKIVATIGPASNSREMLEQFIERGVDVVRFNMSHGSLEDHQRAHDLVREIAAERGVHVATLADLCGPKVRTCKMKKGDRTIAEGETCEIVSACDLGTAQRFGTNYAGFIDDVQPGHRVLIDDGAIRLRAVERRGDSLVCECEVGGEIGSRKGLNVPDSHLSLSALSEKDHTDLAWALENGVDMVALSFVRHPDDVNLLRIAIRKAGAETPIVSKIETPQAIDALDDIIRVSDGVLVARGDLGVEMDVWRIPTLQKDMIRRCRLYGKPVIVATQMLHSMTDNPTPTRAEVSDVANAALDGADAVMLSAESAVGKYPLHAVSMLGRITEQALLEESPRGRRRDDVIDAKALVGSEVDRTTAAVARSVATVAYDLRASLIAVWCRSGRTARWISKYRTSQRIVSLSGSEATCRRMSVCYGIEPLHVGVDFAEGRAPWLELEPRIVEYAGLSSGEVYVLVGDPTATRRTPTLTIHVVP